MNYGKLLKVAMAKRSVGTYQLADLLGVKAQQVSRWRGCTDIKFSTMIKICDALDMSVGDFINDDES
ncbi:MAG: helix-turn-helix domain-containing protein [Bacteroidota bacterium]